MLSAICRQAASALVNCGLKRGPRASKKAFDRGRSLTGRLTKIWRIMVCSSSRLVHGVDGLELLQRLAGREVLPLVELSHLDDGLGAFAHGVGKAPTPLQRLLARAHLDHGVAGDQLLGFCKRAIDHAAAGRAFGAARAVVNAPAG